MFKITWSAISQKPINPPKNIILENIFLDFLLILGSKFKIPITTEIV